MKKFSKTILLSSSLLLLSGCALPFQSDKYPAWTTKGVLESYTLSDGRSIDGWMGSSIGDKINTKWYDFTVNSINEGDTYKEYKASDNKKLIYASITITNTTDKEIYISNEDFALVWNLSNDERSYVYQSKDMNEDEITIKIKETKTIDIIFEVDNTAEKPMALYYFEQYSDGQKGNRYYIYYK